MTHFLPGHQRTPAERPPAPPRSIEELHAIGPPYEPPGWRCLRCDAPDGQEHRSDCPHHTPSVSPVHSYPGADHTGHHESDDCPCFPETVRIYGGEVFIIHREMREPDRMYGALR